MDGPMLPLPSQTIAAWFRAHAPELILALLLAVLPLRDLWAPDDPDFAQCVQAEPTALIRATL